MNEQMINLQNSVLCRIPSLRNGLSNLHIKDILELELLIQSEKPKTPLIKSYLTLAFLYKLSQTPTLKRMESINIPYGTRCVVQRVLLSIRSIAMPTMSSFTLSELQNHRKWLTNSGISLPIITSLDLSKIACMEAQ